MSPIELATRCACRTCGAEMRPGMLRCRHCGTPASDLHSHAEAETDHWERLFAWNSCPKCGADVRDAMLRCRKCGFDLKATADDQKSRQQHGSNPFQSQSIRYAATPRRQNELGRWLSMAANAVRQMRLSDKPMLQEMQQIADKCMTCTADFIVAFIERMLKRMR